MFHATSACLICEYMAFTRGLDLSECLVHAVKKHAENKSACKGTQMKLIQFLREEVDTYGSAHEVCPVCNHEDAKLLEAGVILVYECACQNVFVACRFCNSVMIHELPGFKYRCSSSICGRFVDLDQEGRK